MPSYGNGNGSRTAIPKAHRKWLRGPEASRGTLPNSLRFLLWRWRRLLSGTRVGRALPAIVHSLLTLGLYFVPLFLLVGVQQRPHLSVSVLVNIHHLGAAILARKRTVLPQRFHLGAFRLEDVLRFRLLIGAELELFGQFLGALSGVGRSMAPATVFARGR